MRRLKPSKGNTKHGLVLLRNILTHWESAHYDRARMELAELEQRIKNKIEWINEEIHSLTGKREELEEKLEALAKVKEIEYEVENAESIEVHGFLDHRAYASLTQEEAILKILGNSRNPLSPRQITTRMKEGGYPFKTDDPLNSIYVLLNRLKKEKKVDDETTDARVCFKLMPAKKGRNANTEERDRQ